MKNREIYLIPKSTATLTQSGLLAMLLQRQRQKGSDNFIATKRAAPERKIPEPLLL